MADMTLPELIAYHDNIKRERDEYRDAMQTYAKSLTEATKQLVTARADALEEAAKIVEAHFGKDIESFGLPDKIRSLPGARQQ